MPPKTTTKILCQKCVKSVTKIQSPGLSCVICNKYWHFTCAEITGKVSEEIIANNLSWSCKKCHRRSTIVPGPSSPSSASTSGENDNASTPSTVLIEKIEKLESLLSTAIKRIESLEAQLTAKGQNEEILTKKVNTLEAQAIALEGKLTDDILEIQGLPETAFEDPIRVVTEIGQAIGCPLTSEDLEGIPVLIAKKLSLTFKSKGKRGNFLSAGKYFNKSKKKYQGYRIHINEALTEPQKKLYRETKAFATQNNFKFVWVGVGKKILLKKDENSSLHVIESSHTLSTINIENVLPELQRPPNESSTVPTINISA